MAEADRGGMVPHRRRADARRSIDAIVGAARVVLSERTDASMEDVAAAAGVARQTVYAHFASREALIHAVVDAAAAEALAAMDAAVAAGPAADALGRFFDVGWQLVPLLLNPAVARASRHDGGDPHEAFIALLENLISRGQDSGDFDRGPSPAWLATAIVGMWHAAGDEIRAGRMTAARAAEALRESALRLCGARTPATGAPPRQDAPERVAST